MLSGVCITLLSVVLAVSPGSEAKMYPVYLKGGRTVYSATHPAIAFGSVVILTSEGRVVTYPASRVDLDRTRRNLEAPPGVEGVTITNADIRERKSRFSLVRLGESPSSTPAPAGRTPTPRQRSGEDSAENPEQSWQHRMRADLQEEIDSLSRRMREVQARMASADEGRRAAYQREMEGLRKQIRTLQTQRDALGEPTPPTVPPSQERSTR